MRRALVAAAGTLVLATGPARAASGPSVSWGKAGVAFERYRADAVECGTLGATRDMSGRAELGQVMHGLEVQNSTIDRPPSTSRDEGRLTTPDGIERLRDYSLTQHRTMQRQVPALQRYLVGGVERCLIGKGYARFRLTPDQAKALGGLRRGTERRFRYLHGLASDPAILAAQGMDTAPAAAPAGE